MVDMGLTRPTDNWSGYWCCDLQPVRVLEYNFSHPGFMARNALNKLYHLLFAEEMTVDPLFLRTDTMFSAVTNTLFWAVVMIGAVRFWRVGSPVHLVTIAMLAYGVLSILPFFGHPRLSVSFAPAVFILLAAGMQALWTRRNILSSMRESLGIWSRTALMVGALLDLVLWSFSIGTTWFIWSQSSARSIEQLLFVLMHAVACLGVAAAFIKIRVKDSLRTR